MRKEYKITVFERDGQQRIYNITETELDSFNKLTGILDLQEQKPGAGFIKKRYFNLRDLAWEILIASGVSSLPISLEQIAAANGWALLSYERYAEAIAILDMTGIRKQREGFSCEAAGRAFVCYAEVVNKGRQRWTIAHEFGHLAMRHSASPIENYEQEANMFAARLLMPMCVLKECNATTADQIAALCGTSIEASSHRADRLQMLMQRGKFYTSDYEIKLIKQFEDFIRQNKLT